jgi:nucleotidyltransferase/DNA polymerase involved in DNA repair
VLWLYLRFAHLPIELRAPELGKIAISDRAGAHRLVIAANEAARLAGIHTGMLAPQALMHEPELRLLDRSRAEDVARCVPWQTGRCNSAARCM